MSTFVRYSVTGEPTDGGEWLLVPISLEAGSAPALSEDDYVGVSFAQLGAIESISAGFGLVGGGAAGSVVLSADPNVLATQSDIAGLAPASHSAQHKLGGSDAISPVDIGAAPSNSPTFTGTVTVPGLKATAKILADDAAASNSVVYAFDGDDSTGLGRAGAGVITVVCSGVERLRVSSNGNVGIGTTAPLTKLHVDGTVRASALTDGTTTKTMAEVLSGGSGASSLSGLSDVTVSFDYPATDNRVLQYKASINKWVPSRDGGLISIGALPLGSSWPQQTIGWYVDQRAPKDSPAFTGAASFTASSGVPLTVTNTGSGLSFVVNDQADDQTPFVVSADGRVGVGTASPSVELHVVGTLRATALTDGTNTRTVADIVSGALAGRATHINQKLTPTSATAGTDGQLYWDDDYIYVRTSSGWKRAQLLGLDEAPAAGGGYDQVKLTQAQYDALAVKDPNTLYVIVP